MSNIYSTRKPEGAPREMPRKGGAEADNDGGTRVAGAKAYSRPSNALYGKCIGVKKEKRSPSSRDEKKENKKIQPSRKERSADCCPKKHALTKRQSFFMNGLLLTAVGLAMRGVQLLFGAYISRTVGAEGVGLNALVLTVYSFAVTFATSGISLTVTRLSAAAIGEGREGEISRIIRAAAIYALAFSGAASIALASMADLIGRVMIRNVRVITAMQVLATSLIPAALSSVISGYFVGVRRVSRNAAVGVFGQLLRVGLTVVFLSAFASRGVGAALTALAIGASLGELLCFLAAAVLFAVDRLRRRKAAVGGGADIRAVASMAFPLGISAYIRSALVAAEHSLIPRRLSKHGEDDSSAMASYGYLHGMALPLILYPLTPLTSFSGLLVPEFAEASAEGAHERMRRLASEAVNTTLSYAMAVAVLVAFFAEELGYAVYGSFEAGYYIGMLAPVIPIMYLDHVADSILKGIGEHIYSMWVNIADAALSVVLVYFLIPVMGISGYAMVIIGMEGFNFLLSYLRLRRRIAIHISPLPSVVMPSLCACLASALTDALFVDAGSRTTASLLITKLIFAICAYVAMRTLVSAVLRHLHRRRGRCR